MAYISRGVWEGLSPPQDIWTGLTTIIRHMRRLLDPCCNTDNTVGEQRQSLDGSGQPGELLGIVERRSSGTSCGATEMPSPSDPHRRTCWSCCGCCSCWSLSSSDTFWQIKVRRNGVGMVLPAAREKAAFRTYLKHYSVSFILLQGASGPLAVWVEGFLASCVECYAPRVPQ